MHFQPVSNKIKIKPDPSEDRTPGGLILPSSKVPTTGTVIEVSGDFETVLEKGMRVHYAPNHREEQEDGTILLSEDHIEWIINE